MSEFYHESPDEFKHRQRVQLHPATNLWMRGDRYGEVIGSSPLLVTVLTDRGTVVRLAPSLLAIVGDSTHA